MGSVRRWTAADTASIVQAPRDADDKYSRGVVGMRTGSSAYPGAAVLGVEGAWRAGAGMVRYVGEREVGMLVLQRRPETVLGDGRVGAWVIGSGTDPDARTQEERDALLTVLSSSVRVVVDAGALDLAGQATAPRILTPHDREFARLCSASGLVDEAEGSAGRASATVALAATTGATVLRKGSVTIVADPTGEVVEVRAATPWLATAGAGDVLAGIIGTLAAQRPAVAGIEIAAAGAWLHGRAARIAAGVDRGNGHPITALDVARAVPLAVGEVVGAV